MARMHSHPTNTVAPATAETRRAMRAAQRAERERERAASAWQTDRTREWVRDATRRANLTPRTLQLAHEQAIRERAERERVQRELHELALLKVELGLTLTQYEAATLALVRVCAEDRETAKAAAKRQRARKGREIAAACERREKAERAAQRAEERERIARERSATLGNAKGACDGVTLASVGTRYRVRDYNTGLRYKQYRLLGCTVTIIWRHGKRVDVSVK